MNIPPGMAAQAVIFCSFQPCPRIAEGDIMVGDQANPVCARHAEYIMAYFGGDEVEDPDIMNKEIVFVDDVNDSSMVDEIAKHGNPLEIIG